MDYPRGVRPKGHSIEIRYQHRGQAYSETIPKKPNKTNIAYAAKIRQDRIDRLKQGLSLNDDNQENPLFELLAQKYLKALKVEDSTYDHYRRILNLYWIPELGKWPIKAIRFSDLLSVDSEMEWRSAKNRKNALVPLSGVFNLAYHDDLIASNIVSKLPKQKVQKPPLDPFSEEEKYSILEAFATYENWLECDDSTTELMANAAAYFALFFDTGIRPGEIIALNWDDYDGKHLAVSKVRSVSKLVNSTKTHHARSVLLTAEAKKTLNTLPSRFKKEAIFTREKHGSYKDFAEFNRMWRLALEQANVRYRRPYNCRHTYASLGLMAGAKPGFLSKQLGHSLKMFFETYAKWIESESDDDELAKLEAKKIETGEKLGRNRDRVL